MLLWIDGGYFEYQFWKKPKSKKMSIFAQIRMPKFNSQKKVKNQIEPPESHVSTVTSRTFNPLKLNRQKKQDRTSESPRKHSKTIEYPEYYLTTGNRTPGACYIMFSQLFLQLQQAAEPENKLTGARMIIYFQEAVTQPDCIFGFKQIKGKVSIHLVPFFFFQFRGGGTRLCVAPPLAPAEN